MRIECTLDLFDHGSADYHGAEHRRAVCHECHDDLGGSEHLPAVSAPDRRVGLLWRCWYP